ncbi:unnamed protein product [Triticum turgidum subsp. durum]|uniref:Uncharacterized protein n=2 Tax=Triticum TaxID=4564 RepID=A0A9R0SBI5_TRITD|nr:unnamed protein product [Triticum turgidum subsp. durum]
MVSAEGRQVDEHVKKIIELKYKVRSGSYNNFVVINQKSIGLPSIDLLDRVGVLQILFIDQEILICDMVNLSSICKLMVVHNEQPHLKGACCINMQFLISRAMDIQNMCKAIKLFFTE